MVERSLRGGGLTWTDRSRLGVRVHQKCLMSLLSHGVVESEVISAGGLQPLVSQNLLYVANGTAIEKELSSGCVAKQMWCDSLLNPGELSVALKRSPDVRPF